MGYLSKTAKTETAFESFYGTNMAGSEVATSEMNEDEVHRLFDSSQWTHSCQHRCLRRTRIATSKTNVSAPNLSSGYLMMSDLPPSSHGWHPCTQFGVVCDHLYVRNVILPFLCRAIDTRGRKGARGWKAVSSFIPEWHEKWLIEHLYRMMDNLSKNVSVFGGILVRCSYEMTFVSRSSLMWKVRSLLSR